MGTIFEADDHHSADASSMESPAPRLVYLHGFASGPRSTKVSLIRAACERRGLALATPDLNLPSFRRLSLDAITDMVCYMLARHGGQTFAVGSSLGAAVLLRALARPTAPQVDRVVLLAPVIDHRAALLRVIGEENEQSWRRAGEFEFQHYAAGERLRLWHEFVSQGEPLSDEALAQIDVPVLLVSATDDQIATPDEASRLARLLPDVQSIRIATDHRFAASFGATWAAIEKFIGLNDDQLDRWECALASIDEVRADAALVDEAVAAITGAYGDRSYPPSVHRERIVHEGSVLAWVRDRAQRDAPMVSASYVRGDGKWGAIGVRPQYRGLGLSVMMSRALQSVVYPQFVEVECGLERAERVAVAAGFRPVYDEGTVTAILGRAGHRIACSGIDRLGVRYRRIRRAAGRWEYMRVFTHGHYRGDRPPIQGQ